MTHPLVEPGKPNGCGGTRGSVTQSETIKGPSIARVTIASARLGRVTLEWVLSSKPTHEWIGVFDSLSADNDFRRTVESAYGRPLVMLDGTILWSMITAEAQAAIEFVEMNVARASTMIAWCRPSSMAL